MSGVAHFFMVVGGSNIHERLAHFFIDIYIPISRSDLRILYYDIVTFSTVNFAVCDIVNEVLALSCSLRISV